MADNIQSITYSQKRAIQLKQQFDQVGRMFNINNFYNNNQINLNKLKYKIEEAKKKMFEQRQKEKGKNSQSLHHQQFKQTVNKNYEYSKRNNQINVQQQQIKGVIRKNDDHPRRNNHSVMGTAQDKKQSKEFGVGNHRIKRLMTRGEHKSTHKEQKQSKHIVRMVTDLGEYQIPRKNSYMETDNDQPTISRAKPIINESRMNRIVSHESPIHQHSRSAASMDLEHIKIVIGDVGHFKQFEMKIILLWQLYQSIVSLMQSVGKFENFDQRLVLEYIGHVTSNKYQFIHQMCDSFSQNRIQRCIRLSRVLQNFSIFQMCLTYADQKKSLSTQIINYLGYSSSSVIFLIKILLLTHQTAFTFNQNTKQVVDSIISFQISSYKSQIRNIKDILRRLEHNNEIIGLIKSRSGKKHGKYCEDFINKIIKSVDKVTTPFYECSNNIFEFMAFYLHLENVSGRLPELSTPPSPFLSLAYSKTIIIDPWCVLANRKNNKLVIRAHTGKFLAEVSDSCNLIFWTDMMPKDAEVLVNLFPVKQNVYWLYRYHCRQNKDHMIKLINLVGCLTQNTIIIDSIVEHFAYNPQIGITMYWKGQKKDTKLLSLSQIFQTLFSQTNANKTDLQKQLQKMKQAIQGLNSKPYKLKKL